MTDIDNPADTAAEARTEVIPAEPAPVAVRRVSWILILVFVLLFLSLGLAIWQLLNTRHRFNELEQTLTQRLEQYSAVNRQSTDIAARAEARSAEVAAASQLLEQKLAESREQQEALQTLYLELANNREERLIAEVEQLLTIADQQLQIAGNIKPALLALQTAVTRLQHMDTPQANILRKAIGQDIQRLQTLPQVNIASINATLETLSTDIETLPLVSDRHSKAESAAEETSGNSLHRLFSEMWRDIREMIRLERIDRPEPPLLSPEQTFFLRENLKLRLLLARIALLQHDGATYRTTLHDAGQWLKQHFDTSDPRTARTIASLERLSASSIDMQAPDISGSLSLASNYKLSLEKPVAGSIIRGPKE